MPAAPQGFRVPLYLQPYNGPVLIAFVGLVHAGALAAVFAAALPVVFKVVLAGIAGISLLLSLRRIRARTGLRVVLNADDDWFVIDATGQTRALTPVDGLLLHPKLLLLTFRDEEGDLLPCLFTAWNTDAGSLRRLRVRLRRGIGGTAA